MRQTYARPTPRASPTRAIRITRAGDPEIARERDKGPHPRATTASARPPSFPVIPFPSREETPMFRPALLAVPLIAACTSAGLAFAADPPTTHGPGARASAPPTGALQIVLRPQSLRFIDNPPKRSGDGPPSPGDASIITFRAFDASGAKRLGRAQFVCTATDARGAHEQCSGTIALPDGQIATQGDADNVAVVGGSGAYAGARGTATGNDHPDSVDVTFHFLP